MKGGFGYLIALLAAPSSIALLLQDEKTAGAIFFFISIYSLVQAEA